MGGGNLGDSHVTYPFCRINCSVPTDQATLEAALDCLLEPVPLKAQGDCDPKTLYEVLLRAACRNDSVEHICINVGGSPDWQ